MLLTAEDIRALDRQRRAALINSISGFKPANLVGTVDKQGNTNLAIMSSLVHIGAAPPLLALVLRPDTSERHTLSNIRDVGSYTINHVGKSFISPAHQTSARYPKECSEFAAAGLTEKWYSGCSAPFVAEAAVKIGMQLQEEHTLRINGTHLLIGSVTLLELPEQAVTEQGTLDPALAESTAVAGLDTYYEARLLQRFAYAKPDKGPLPID
ncbi:MAG: flavin reductase [Pseudomonadota bacterium]